MAKRSTRSRSTTPRKKAKSPKNTRRDFIPLWNLERDGITQSGLSLWEVCPEQFALGYIEGLEHKSLKEPVQFGSLFHLCSEHRGTPPLEAMRAYRETAAKNHPDQDYMRAFDHLVQQVAAIFPAYEQQYPIEKEPPVVKAEESFAIPVTVLNTTFQIKGKIDAQIQSKRNLLALKEIKTKSTIDKEKIRYLLRSDLQTLIYLWAMRKLNGHCPAYLMYDVIKRPTLKVLKSETLKEHYARIQQHALDRPDMYFFRWRIDPITDDDLDKFEHEIFFPLLRCFVSWWAEVRSRPLQRNGLNLHHLNLNALSDPWKKSDFYDLLILGRRDLYRKKSSPHPELSE